MEGKGVVLCSVVALLGVVSAATGFAAEFTKIKPSDVNFVSHSQCSYPRSAAFGLGLTAAAALLMAQLIINFATGCFYCERLRQTRNLNCTNALVFYVISGITFVIAVFLLLSASLFNDQHAEDNTYNGNYYCYIVKPGIFAGGGFLAALSVIFGIFYYVTLNTRRNTTNPWGNAPLPNPNPNQGGIAMGQPMFPPQSSQGHVFVHIHEDTLIFVDEDFSHPRSESVN